MSSPSSASFHSDEESDTSSVVYDHEPFTTFRSRVLALATSTIWPDLARDVQRGSDEQQQSPDDQHVRDELLAERLPGGGFNRIIGLTRLHWNAQPITKTQYILRIPRFDAAQVENDVAVLQFIHHHTAIPAPEVIAFDQTEDNALGSPYAVQNRIPGTDLYSSFPKLSHEEQCRVARELGGIFSQMLAVRSSTAGRLVLSKDPENIKTSDVAPLTTMEPKLVKPYSDSAPPESVHDLLMTIFRVHKAHGLEHNPSDTLRPKLWDRFCRMTSELDAAGWLVDQHYSIAHLDLAPRNIMVNPTADVRRPIISGILDWDSAVLAPMFMSCAPPLWVWAWQDDEDEDEQTANDSPPTQEGRQLKTCFEEAAGQDYMRFAYEPAHRLARRLFRFAIDGVQSNEDFREAEAMLQDWVGVMKSQQDVA